MQHTATKEWFNPATPKELAEQMMLHQSEQSEVLESFRSTMPLGTLGTTDRI